MGVSLVTGAAGFVGRHVVEELLTKGDVVRAMVRNPSQGAELRDLGADVLVGDIRDPVSVELAVRGADVVYHCAAAVGERYTRRDFEEVNLEGARRVLAAARKTGCRRVVLLSSLHVLGIGDLENATEELPCRRTYDPASNVKIDMERMALETTDSDTEAVVLRLGVVYGPGDPHNLPKLIAALRNGKFRFLGSRGHLVPIVHVADAAEAMLLAARAPACGGRIYHITDGSRTTIGEFIDHLADLSRSPRPQRILPVPALRTAMLIFSLLRRIYPACPLPVGPGPLRFLGTSRYVDVARARSELGYAPRFGYREGLADAIGEAAMHPFQPGEPRAVPA